MSGLFGNANGQSFFNLVPADGARRGHSENILAGCALAHQKGGLMCGHSTKRGVLGAGTANKRGVLDAAQHEKGGIRNWFCKK